MRSGARLTPVEVDENLIGSEPEPEARQPSQTASALTSILFMSLRALSQRAVVALGNLFMAASAASAWWLWYVTMPQPTVPQLVGLTLYAAFILALNFMLRRK
jgi:hypothetical protein